jgi:hypothetical protein
MMKIAIAIKKLLLGLSFACVLLSASVVLAQDEDAEAPDPAESTIRLMGTAEADLPGAVTREIRLPEAVRENAAAVEKAQRGLENARDNRDNGREQGLSQADQARDRGADMAEEARQNRENRGRFEDRPTPPERPQPDRPEPPRGPPGN